MGSLSVIVAENEPVKLAVTGVGTVTRGIPSKVMVIAEPLAKFCPFTVITKLFVFFRPVCGAIVIEGLTVKMVDAEFRLGLSSVATILWFPDVDVGTVKVALNDPVADAVITPGDVTITLESNLMVMTALGAKLEPDIETVEPTTPFVGFAFIEGTKTVKSAVELSDGSAAVIL